VVVSTGQQRRTECNSRKKGGDAANLLHKDLQVVCNVMRIN
jgi:hypothetical protein